MRARRIVPWLMATAILMAASSAVTWRIVRDDNVPASMLKSPQIQRFIDTYQLIRTEFIWHNTTKKLLVGATGGMMGGNIA